MIFYFSTTGNSKYLSERISKAISEKAIDRAKCFESGEFKFDIKDGEKNRFHQIKIY